MSVRLWIYEKDYCVCASEYWNAVVYEEYV